MDPTSHILEWACNNGILYRRLEQLSKSRSVPILKATDAVNIATSTVRDMIACREITPLEYSANHILEAAKLMLEWTVGE